MKFIIVAFTTFLLCLSLTKAKNVTIKLDGDIFSVTYSFVNTTSNPSIPTINLILVGNTTGWMGIGFNKDKKSMFGSDFMIAGYDANQTRKGYVMDCHLPNGTNRAPIKDTQQDWTLMEDVTLVKNSTRLVVQRKLNTNDTNDMAIEKEKQFILLWAYKATPWNASGGNVHDKRGTLTVNLSLDNPIVDDSSGASTLCSVGMGTLLASLLLVLRY